MTFETVTAITANGGRIGNKEGWGSAAATSRLRWGRGVTISIFLVPLLVIGIVLISQYLLREKH